MPKMKTNRAAAKRFKITANGKAKFARAFRRHLLEAKSPKMRRQARNGGMVHESDLGRIRRLLPYG